MHRLELGWKTGFGRRNHRRSFGSGVTLSVEARMATLPVSRPHGALRLIRGRRSVRLKPPQRCCRRESSRDVAVPRARALGVRPTGPVRAAVATEQRRR